MPSQPRKTKTPVSLPPRMQPKESLVPSADISKLVAPSSSRREFSSRVIEDEIGQEVAFRFGFVGIGQGGGNVAIDFYNLGYRRVCLINTNQQDCGHAPDDIPRLDLSGRGVSGAGKDPGLAAAMLKDRREDVFDFLASSIGGDVDYLFVVAGFGGGTGSGCAAGLVDIARDFIESNGGNGANVGVFASLPMRVEGSKIAHNALNAFREVYARDVSPFVITDNQRIKDIYRPSARRIWDDCNSVVTTSFHALNVLAAQRGQLATFDRQDMATILDSGVITFGQSVITSLESTSAIASSVRGHIEDSVLVKLDISKGTHAALVLVASDELLDQTDSDVLDYAFDALHRMLAPGATVHRGIYVGTEEGLTAFSMIGGMGPPLQRLEELKEASGAFLPGQSLESFFEV